MGSFRVRVINDQFAICCDHDYPDRHVAVREAIRGALEIGAEKVTEGVGFFAAEIRIEQGEQLLERHFVSIGRSCLQK